MVVSDVQKVASHVMQPSNYEFAQYRSGSITELTVQQAWNGTRDAVSNSSRFPMTEFQNTT